MIEDKIMIKCDLCNMSFQFGHHRYDGKHLASYNMSVCNSCLRGNWDGVGPAREEAFIKHLQTNNITLPARNDKGWYPLE
jgi:hypothetical protein